MLFIDYNKLTEHGYIIKEKNEITTIMHETHSDHRAKLFDILVEELPHLHYDDLYAAAEMLTHKHFQRCIVELCTDGLYCYLMPLRDC